MLDVATIPDTPPSELRRRRSGGGRAAFHALVSRRDLIATLARRNFKARYKQTVLGVGWAVLQPLLAIAVFALFVRRIAHADTGGAPYMIWAYLGLLPWQLFASAISAGGVSLLVNQPLLNKVYSPRQIYPLASVLLACVDALVSLATLSVIFVAYTYAPKPTIYWIPLVLLVLVMFTAGVTLIVSILTVYVRDLQSLIPTALQLGLFASPVVYSLSQIPARYRLLYCFINPMGPIIDSLRRTVLFGLAPNGPQLLAGTATSVVILVVGLDVFARFEQGIVDII